ncbi:MFS polyamine transporter [Rickenella mellea]|uniref:MFS polyamine transporter n=1 Tax=Rickenella mellea TaxID=50990 RepID=A0A4Y7PKZ3_9AGAM|nr:MFS polyamine transporter [Rickenella mellea]
MSIHNAVGVTHEIKAPSTADYPNGRSSCGSIVSISELTINTLEEGSDIKTASGPTIIDWDGPDDPQNPLNWSFKRKWGATAIVSAYTFMTVVSSSIVAPASNHVAKDFGMANSVAIAMVTSIFVLGYAFGPLFIAPLSEIYGRSWVLQLANLFYLVCNIACAFSKTQGELIAFRFLAGLGGSAPFAIEGGMMADCWRSEERGQAIALYSLVPLLGNVIGPVAGSWIAEKASWRWIFWSTTIADGVVQVFGLIFLRETFALLLLERKANRIKKQLGIPDDDQSRMRTVYQSPERHWRRIFTKAIARPFAIFAREPIVQLLGLYLAFTFGIIFLLLTTIPSIFQNTYHFRIGIAGLHYISLGIGLSIANQLSARITDRVYAYLKKRNGGIGQPEFRLPMMVVGTIFLPVGLLLTGWSAELAAPWILPDIGIAFVGAGMVLNFQGTQTYIMDVFTIYSASGLAAVTCLRSLTGFGFPLFAPAMYETLGYGKSCTILALAAIVLGCPAPWLFWHFGERIRSKSRYIAD